jgi:AcrR family transcriptional regulator
MSSVPLARRSGRAAPLPPDERRQAIVRAVIPLIVTHGASVPTRLIAEAAGVAEGTIFRVFPDKNALLVAAAEETLNPSDARESLAAAVAGIDDLAEVVRVVTARMVERSEHVSAVLMALRRVWISQAAAGEHDGPPAFVVESHRALLERLTAVFEPFRDELTVPPERAALLLRTLVLGSRHPGMEDEDRLSVDEITHALLEGVHRAPDREP